MYASDNQWTETGPGLICMRSALSLVLISLLAFPSQRNLFKSLSLGLDFPVNKIKLLSVGLVFLVN